MSNNPSNSENLGNLGDTGNQIVQAQNMKFLFLFPIQNTAESCCCGCTLRLGTKILTILHIFSAITHYFRIGSGTKTVYDGFGDYYHYSTLLLGIFELIGCSLILASTFNNKFEMASNGMIFYTLYLWALLINIIVMPFIVLPYIHEKHGSSPYLVYFSIIIPGFFVAIYFSYILFSFVKELGFGNYAKIDGVQVIVVPTDYQNNFTQNSTNMFAPSNTLFNQNQNLNLYQGYAVGQPVQGQPVYPNYNQFSNQVNQFQQRNNQGFIQAQPLSQDQRSIQLQQLPLSQPVSQGQTQDSSSSIPSVPDNSQIMDNPTKNKNEV